MPIALRLKNCRIVKQAVDGHFIKLLVESTSGDMGTIAVDLNSSVDCRDLFIQQENNQFFRFINR